MNKNFNEWYIDIKISPEEGQLSKRISTVESFAKSVTANDIVNLVKIYYDINVDSNFKTSFSRKFSESDPAFSLKYVEELRLLAGATLLEIAETNAQFDSFAELLTISHSFFHLPSSLVDILTCMISQFDIDRRDLRESKIKLQKIDNFDLVSFEERFQESESDESTSELYLETFRNIHTSIKSLSESLTSVNRQNAIYQEDSQILWWMTACWSTELNCSYKNLDKLSASMIVGKEASSLVTNFPCPYAMQGVLFHILSCCKGKSNAISISDLITKSKRDWLKKLSVEIDSHKILNLLPILSAIVRSDNTESSDEWFPKYDKEIIISKERTERTPNEYAWQMFLEMTTLHCYDALASEDKANG